MWWSAYLAAVLVAAAAAGAGAAYSDNVTVTRLQVALEEELTLQMDSSVEYILQFVPSAEQSAVPTRVRVRSHGGDSAHPLLVTARQRSGALSWQLPYYSGEDLLYELERTLCPDDTAAGNQTSDCTEESETARRGEFSIHLGSACAASFTVSVRASTARDWLLARPGEPATHTQLSQEAPRVHYYRWAEDEHSVRLVVQAEDDVCATVAVQEYTCPITQTLDEMEGATVRMTVQRSGGTQLARSRYPSGFYVIVATGDSDAACTGEPAEPAEQAWLWEAAVWPALPDQAAGQDEPRRFKRITIHMKASLSRAQYAVGSVVTLALCLLFYVGFCALVVGERWPRWQRLVRPKAKLAEQDTGGLSQLERSPRRRRRDSTATFDSSDNSDTDSDEDATTGTLTTPVSPGLSTPGHTSPGHTSPGHTSPGHTSPGQLSPTHASPVATIQLRDSAITRADVLERDEVRMANPAAITLERTVNPVNISDNVILGEASVNPAGNVTSAVPENGSVNPAFNGVVGENVADPGGTVSTEESPRPFGLPARLHLAALAKRQDRVLRARSDRYLYTLYTVAVFYALPVVQFVAAFQLILNVSGSLDLCYYNFLCAHPLGALSDFNHVFSNLGYLLLGALFMLQVRRRRMRRKRQPRDAAYGIPQHYGLLSSLGAGMMVVALLSASYHVCPNRLNFQFDTSFMYVLCVLCMVKIYQSRHPDINARAHATFGVLAVMIALVVWGVLGGGALFWAVFTVLHVFTFLLLSLQIYYVGQFRLEKESLAETARALRSGSARPLYTARLVALLLANAVNWGFALYGLVVQASNFASHLLFVLLCNTLLYIVFYLCMKLLCGERVRWYCWLTLAGAAAAWLPALYYFTSGSTDWSATPAQSRLLNHECRVLQFYDSHDLWHGLSAVALYLTFTAILMWDDGLSAVKRTEIAVF